MCIKVCVRTHDKRGTLFLQWRVGWLMGIWEGKRCREVSPIGSNGGCVVLFSVKKCLFLRKFLVMTKIMRTFGVIFI